MSGERHELEALLGFQIPRRALLPLMRTLALAPGLLWRYVSAVRTGRGD